MMRLLIGNERMNLGVKSTAGSSVKAAMTADKSRRAFALDFEGERVRGRCLGHESFP